MSAAAVHPVHAGSFEACALDDPDVFLAAAERLPAATPFQGRGWLASWYATLGRREGSAPLGVVVRRGGEAVLVLPLAVRRERGLAVARFADDGVSDYNAPLVACGLTAREVGVAWGAARQALGGVDLLLAEKIPAAHPFARAVPAVPSALSGNLVAIDADWERWRRSLDKTVRKEFERTWRVFGREPAARFERVDDPARAREVLQALEDRQRERMAGAGERYRLDRPAWRDLYAQRLRDGLADGSAVLTALTARDEVVAALYGLSDGTRYVAVRISHAGDAWKQCAPGKLLLERTMHHLHGLGVRQVDLGLGDYFHKRAFKAARLPLVDACLALSWRGRPVAWAWRAKRWLRRQAG